MIPDRLKKIIFRKLYNDLSHVEIIPFNNSIWFVDRDEKYWYFELQKDGTLWWRYQFFSDFFILFSLERDDYQSILAQWVEEVLNSKVDTTLGGQGCAQGRVEEVLNFRVHTTLDHHLDDPFWVEEVLNSRVNTTKDSRSDVSYTVEEVLNSRVIKTSECWGKESETVEDVLNSRVNTTPCVSGALQEKVDEVLNSKVLRIQVALHSTSVMAEGVLNCGDSAPTIGERLNHKVSQAKEGELFDETIVDTVLSSLRSF